MPRLVAHPRFVTLDRLPAVSRPSGDPSDSENPELIVQSSGLSRHGVDDQQAEGSALRGLAGILRRRRWLSITVLVTVPAFLVGIALFQPDRYSASAKILFRDLHLAQRLSGSDFTPPPVDPVRQVATNLELVNLRDVYARAATRLPGLTAAETKDRVKVAPAGPSDVVTVTATDGHPKRAARIATVVAQQVIELRRLADIAAIRYAQRLVARRIDRLSGEPRGSAEGRELRELADELGVFATLHTGGAQLVQRAAVPESPSSPQPASNALIGLLVGFPLAIAIAVWRDRLDRRIRSVTDAETPALGIIPRT